MKEKDNPAIVDPSVPAGETPNVAVPLAMGDNAGKTPEEVKAEREEEGNGGEDE